MKRTRLPVLMAAVLSLVLIKGIGFAEENTPAAAPQVTKVAPAQPAQEAAAEAPATTAVAVNPVEIKESVPPTTTEFETQWVWGEITSLDPQAGKIAISYFDYETDTEKELKLSVDEKTKFENLNSINDLKLRDTISVDYILSPDGNYAARNISVEKPEETAASEAAAADKPAQVKP